MRQNQLNEANAILQRALVNLLGAVPAQSGIPVDALRTAVGALQAASVTEIAAGAVGDDIGNCFALATAAGATYDTMDRVRAACRAETPQFLPGQLLVTALVRFSLIQMALILNATTFVSRQQVDTAIDRIDPHFDGAELYAAENNDQDDYVALVALRCASVTDLTTRQRPLPAMITFSFQQSMPALWMVQRLYGDASRAQELVAENKIVHPLFCVTTGQCLAT